ncbi:MAG: aminotransferase class III-fold pyridoxal phosphate-dependent enzyme [Planctomycetota bacterium]|nr:aminotransferase class III-fold pyridoxal phosphate-dependent enzyme [Planctomycetota bacterium]
MSATDVLVIDGYDLRAENDRLAFPDHEICGRSLNRGTAKLSPEGTPHGESDDVKSDHVREIFPNTIAPDSPVVDMSYPTAGMFVDSPAGVYMDLYQGVAQKLFDERHAAFEDAVCSLAENHLAFRREINTDDYLTFSTPVKGVHTAGDLAGLANQLAAERFPGLGAFRTFFSNSGAEAGEAAIKMGQIHAYRKFIAAHGLDTLARLMEQLGISRIEGLDQPGDKEPLYSDYPFVTVACEGAFHGRTLGVLNMTRSKKVQRLGFATSPWFRHIPFNGSASDLTEMIDTRPIQEILDAEGGVPAVLAQGSVPVDLASMICLECYQGEGGYRIADQGWLKDLAGAARDLDMLFGVDEVQSFGRTGRVWAVEHFDVEPDIVWMSKGAVVGMTVARADLAENCTPGWHSNTFGGGKLFDVNMAYVTLNTLVNGKEPLFEGRSYLENSVIKAEYLRVRLEDLSARHPDTLTEFSGMGGMWGLTVRHRSEIVEAGWKMGLKLLGCGPPGELARIRIILLVDVLTREIDEMVDALDRVFTVVEQNKNG